MKVSVLSLKDPQYAKNDLVTNMLIDQLSSIGIEVAILMTADIQTQIEPYLELAQKVSGYLIIVGADKAFKIALGANDSDIYTSYNSLEIAFADFGDGDLKLFDTMVLPVILSKSGTKYFKHIIKTYGISVDDVKDLLKNISRAKAHVQIDYLSIRSLNEIVIKYSDNMSKSDVDTIIQEIKNLLGKAVYAEGDITLAKKAFDLLNSTKKTIAIAESYTGGMITSELVKIAKASNVLTEGIVSYSNKSKIIRLNVSPETIKSEGAVSVETAYQMAVGLLNTGADIALATTGYAGPDGKEVGLCYLALGDSNGVHIYKNKFQGSREEIIKSGTENALFMLINNYRE